jgi:hypothetical protein
MYEGTFVVFISRKFYGLPKFKDYKQVFSKKNIKVTTSAKAVSNTPEFTIVAYLCGTK